MHLSMHSACVGLLMSTALEEGGRRGVRHKDSCLECLGMLHQHTHRPIRAGANIAYWYSI